MSLSRRIKVLVRHRDPISQVGLQVVFGAYPDLELMANTACVGADALSPSVDAASADVVVADYDEAMMIASEDEDAGRGNLARAVVVVTASDREIEIRQAMERKIRGYLLHGCGLDELAAAVREVHRGGRYLSAAVAQRLAENVSAAPLTRRESQVLQSLVAGLGNKGIARTLDIGIGTVKSHLKSIFDKLGVANRTQAVAAAERRGLLCATPARAAERAAPARSMLNGPRYATSPYGRRLSAVAEMTR